jgi:hypothetical protein
MADRLKQYTVTVVQLLVTGVQVGYAFHKTTALSVGSAAFLILLSLRAILIEAAETTK